MLKCSVYNTERGRRSSGSAVRFLHVHGDASGIPLVGDAGLDRNRHSARHLERSGFHGNGRTSHGDDVLRGLCHGVGGSVADPGAVRAGPAAALADDHGDDDDQEGHEDACADVDGIVDGSI